MEQAAFTGGIRPGGLTKSYEVNILICYILAQVGEPMTFAQLADTTQRDQLVNYFEFAQAMSLLEKSGQLELRREEDGREVYALTGSGLHQGFFRRFTQQTVFHCSAGCFAHTSAPGVLLTPKNRIRAESCTGKKLHAESSLCPLLS